MEQHESDPLIKQENQQHQNGTKNGEAVFKVFESSDFTQGYIL